jgi:hypothetical protein
MKKKPNRILISSLLITILCVAALALIATLPGGGWWFGAQVQNLSSNTASVTYTIYDFDSTSAPQSFYNNIGPRSSWNYSTGNLALQHNFQGSSRVSSGYDIRAIVNLTNRFISGSGLGDGNSPSPAAGQYQGTNDPNDTGTTLNFPLVKNDHWGKSTTIIVQNVGTADATASATFHFPNWTYTYTTPTLKPGRMAAIEPINAHSGMVHFPTNDPTNSVGSLTVTSSQPLAGIALEHKTMEDHATVLQSTHGFTTNDYDTIVYAPINKNDYYHRFTGLRVQNVSSGPVDMTVTYVAPYAAPTQNNPNGCQGGTFTDHATGVAPNTSYTFVQPNTTHLPVGCFGSATVKATGGNVVAVVNEAFMPPWLNDHPGHANEATAYNAIPNKFATTKLSVPLYKEDSYSKDTAISIENVGAAPATNVVITLKGPTGTYTSNPLSIDTGAAYVAMDLRFKPISFWKNGIAPTPTVLGCQNTTTGCGANGVFSVIVTSDQNIVGVTNESTYPITAPRINQDKSNYEAFNLP